MNYSGYIEVIYGPMFAGKSSELIRRVKRHSYANRKCLVVNYANDTRYTEDPVVCTHDGYKVAHKLRIEPHL